MHDLLDEPLLTWRDAGRRRHGATLPGLLAALSRGEVADFPRARAHQFHPWSMFLTQLAALAMRRKGLDIPPTDEPSWKEGLSGGVAEAWCLVVEDLSKPAFFQAPVPEGMLTRAKGGEWAAIEHPDDLDVLITAKSHDVKQSTVAASDVEAWVYALCALQTMQGFPGRGYHGVARMKGGFGNRPRIGLTPDAKPSGRFRRDVRVLLDRWNDVLALGFAEDGQPLLWLTPWDGSESLNPGSVAPHFIEICRRARMVRADAGLVCRTTTNEARRFTDGRDQGDVGDPWIPVGREDAGALTISARGFDYRRVVDLLLGSEWRPAMAQELRPEESSVWWSAWAMVRGQGKTEGLHERFVPISGRTRRLLGDPGGQQRVGERARAWIGRADTIRSKVLFPALKKLARDAAPFRDDLDARIDEVFFTLLFETFERDLDDGPALRRWEERLFDLAKSELERALAAQAMADATRWRAISDAQAAFDGGLRKHFTDTWTALRGTSLAGDRDVTT